jgi:hypothetical protein
LATVSLAREAVNHAVFLEISGIAAFRRYSLGSVCGILGHGSMIPALVSGGYFWCLVSGGALKALGVIGETRRYSWPIMQIAWAGQLGFISLDNCNLENLTFAGEFGSDIDVAERESRTTQADTLR